MPQKKLENQEKSQKELLKLKEKFLSHPGSVAYRKLEDAYHHRVSGNYLADFIYGSSDGVITTFAVVAGAIGAELSNNVIIIIGLANLFADGLSMAMADYLSRRSENLYEEGQREKERLEVEKLPEVEIYETREILEKYGFSGKHLEETLKTLISNKEKWIDFMMIEELQIFPKKDDPKKHAVVTFFAFAIIGSIPLLSYLFHITSGKFVLSIILTGLALFISGALRSLIIPKNWFRAGLEILAVGSAAAAVAYGIGRFIEGLVS